MESMEDLRCQVKSYGEKICRLEREVAALRDRAEKAEEEAAERRSAMEFAERLRLVPKMDYKQYIDKTTYEANLKQRLANLIGRGFEDLSGLSVEDLLREVEIQKQDYVYIGKEQVLMKPEIEDAYLFINTGFPFNP